MTIYSWIVCNSLSVLPGNKNLEGKAEVETFLIKAILYIETK